MLLSDRGDICELLLVYWLYIINIPLPGIFVFQSELLEEHRWPLKTTWETWIVCVENWFIADSCLCKLPPLTNGLWHLTLAVDPYPEWRIAQRHETSWISFGRGILLIHSPSSHKCVNSIKRLGCRKRIKIKGWIFLRKSPRGRKLKNVKGNLSMEQLLMLSSKT